MLLTPGFVHSAYEVYARITSTVTLTAVQLKHQLVTCTIEHPT